MQSTGSQSWTRQSIWTELEVEPGPCPKSAPLFLGCFSLVSASRPFSDWQQFFKSSLWDSWKVMEAGVYSLQARNSRGGEQKGPVARSPTGSCLVSGGRWENRTENVGKRIPRRESVPEVGINPQQKRAERGERWAGRPHSEGRVRKWRRQKTGLQTPQSLWGGKKKGKNSLESTDNFLWRRKRSSFSQPRADMCVGVLLTIRSFPCHSHQSPPLSGSHAPGRCLQGLRKVNSLEPSPHEPPPECCT